MLKRFFIFAGCLLSEIAFSQSNLETIKYSKLVKYKVDENRFDLGWPNAYKKVICFWDHTKPNRRLEPKQQGLKIIPGKITIDKKSRIFQINGRITGGWEGASIDEFEIYVGHRTDSFSNITMSQCFNCINRYNGAKIDSDIVIATVPVFYLKNFKRFNAYWRTKNLTGSNYKDIFFNINTIIDEKSILVFGLLSTYVEIFEVGKLLTQ